MKNVKTKSKTKEVKVKIEDKTKAKTKAAAAKNIKSAQKKTPVRRDAQIEIKKSYGSIWKTIILLMPYILIILLAAGLKMQNERMTTQDAQIEALITTKVDTLKAEMAQEFIDSRMIYVCNVEKIYQELKVEERNKNFELELDRLNNEVRSAQRKIDSLKKSKMKANYSDVYLNSLVAKRDKIAEDYQNALQQTLAYVNQALSEVATEQGVNTIYRNKAMAVNTKYTIDVTPQILEKIKKYQEENEGDNSAK